MPGRFASNTVSAIQATPNTATTAIMPARNTSFLAMFIGLVLVKMMMSAPAMSMNIWIVSTIDSGLPLTSGRTRSKAPSIATITIAPTKIHIATHCCVDSFWSSSVADSPYTNLRLSGSAMSC